MNHLHNKPVLKLPEDIIIEILHRLPSKSLARFKCVSKHWRKYIALCYRRRCPQPYLIGFFYQVQETRTLIIPSQIRFLTSSKDSLLVIDGGLDGSVNCLGRRVYIVASSNGFLLCSKHIRRKVRDYDVYNPATRQVLALPETQISMEDPAVGFVCKSDKDVMSFTIVRYVVSWPNVAPSPSVNITIESFSSDTNVWTSNNLAVEVPFKRCRHRSWEIKISFAGVIDGVFFWLHQRPGYTLDDEPQRLITVYDSVNKQFWALKFPLFSSFGEIPTSKCCLGLSDRALYFARSDGRDIYVWRLKSSIRSRDAVWVSTYSAKVANTVLIHPGLEYSPRTKVQNLVIHPALPHIFYVDIGGKVISYDMETDIAELVYDFGESGRITQHYKLFSYEWDTWPRLL